MKQEVKDLYLCLLCSDGYVRGLRERWAAKASKSYAEGMIAFLERDRMNKFVKENLKILGIKNKAVLVIDLDSVVESTLNGFIIDLMNKITKCYDVKIIGISKYHNIEKLFNDRFQKGYNSVFFKQIKEPNENFSVKYIISNDRYNSYTYLGKPNSFKMEEEMHVVEASSAEQIVKILESEYFGGDKNAIVSL